MNYQDLLVQFAALGGTGALIAAIVNVIKTIGWIKDGQAPTIVTALNLIGLIALFAVKVFHPSTDVAGLDQGAGDLAVVLVTVFAFVWQIVSSKLTHLAIKGTPVVGTSYTVQAEIAKAKSFQLELDQRKQE